MPLFIQLPRFEDAALISIIKIGFTKSTSLHLESRERYMDFFLNKKPWASIFTLQCCVTARIAYCMNQIT
jgi:hypothetical protein